MNPSNLSPSPLTSAQNSLLASSPQTSAGVLNTAKEKFKDTAQETAQKLKSTAAETAQHLRERASEMAAKRKEGVADRLDGISHAVHDSAKTLEEKDPNIAWLTHRAAERLESAASYVRNRDLSGLRADAEDIARRHPLAFLGGLFVAGLVIGNLVKATRPASSSSDWADEALADDSSDVLASAEIAEAEDPWPSSSNEPTT